MGSCCLSLSLSHTHTLSLSLMGSYIDGNYHTYAYLFVPIRTCLIGGPTGSHQPHHLRKGIDDGLKMEVEFGVNY